MPPKRRNEAEDKREGKRPKTDTQSQEAGANEGSRAAGAARSDSADMGEDSGKAVQRLFETVIT